MCGVLCAVASLSAVSLASAVVSVVWRPLPETEHRQTGPTPVNLEQSIYPNLWHLYISCRPHAVVNLEQSIAVSYNFVDDFALPHFLRFHATRASAIDPRDTRRMSSRARAAELAEQVCTCNDSFCGVYSLLSMSWRSRRRCR